MEWTAEAEETRPTWEVRLQTAHSGPLVMGSVRETVLGLMLEEEVVPKGRPRGTRGIVVPARSPTLMKDESLEFFHNSLGSKP